MKSIEQLTEELEAVKKERDDLKHSNVTALDEILAIERQRDEAVKLLEEVPGANDFTFASDFQNAIYRWIQKRIAFLSRLSSGETKLVEVDNDQILKLHVETLSGETKPVCKMCNGKRMVGHMTTEGGETYPCPDCCNPSNNLSSEKESPWISVEDRLPECTEPAMWYNDQNVHEVMFENDHAIVWAFNDELGVFKAKYSGRGYWSEISSISIKGSVKPTYWMPLPAPPESLTDKTE